MKKVCNFLLYSTLLLYSGFLNTNTLEATTPVNRNKVEDLKTSEAVTYEKYWVQYSDKGNLLFRYIINKIDSICPVIVVDNQEITTKERDNKYKTEFPIKICQSVINSSSIPNTVQYKDTIIKTKIDDLKKISVIGDTGCIIDGKLQQSCDLKEEYPFSDIAQKISAGKPNLIIHVGDYFYSKNKCEKNDCKRKLENGSDYEDRPFGDNFETWRSDFIDNGSQFFNSAPIVFTRGNHELCHRGGKGWAVLFDPSEAFRECTEYTDPYLINTKNMRFIVLDSANATDSEEEFDKPENKKKSEQQVDTYKKQFDSLAGKVDDKKQNIFITHRPLFSKELRNWVSNQVYDLNYVLHKAIEESNFKEKLHDIDIVLSGHTHTAMLIELKNEDKSLFQLIAGNGGAHLYKNRLFDHDEHSETEMDKIFDMDVDSTYQHTEFGYNDLLVNPDGKIGSMQFYNWKGEKLSLEDLW